jgi:hypothetical protein
MWNADIVTPATIGEAGKNFENTWATYLESTTSRSYRQQTYWAKVYHGK